MKNSEQKTSRESNERLGDQGGYFDLVIRPMLQQGHEGELCSWLKEMSLIRTVSNCQRVECKGKSLVWQPARIVDKYTWTCSTCARKQSIRENSFFYSIQCDLKMCLQLILAWCQSIDSDSIASYLDVKKHVVKKVYERCDKVSEFYVMQHPEEWVLGGEGAILIVDEFPGGYMAERIADNVTSKKRNNNSHNIVCIAEASAIPPRMWLHIVRATPEPLKENKLRAGGEKYNMAGEALKEIVGHAAAGSYIIANSRARTCNYESLRQLKQYTVISVEELQKFDPPGENKLVKNLETIWQTTADICEDIQDTTYIAAQHIITTQLWKQRFGSSPSTAFQYMLNHITESYRFS